ncbi:MAG: hypothetical protein HFG88_11210 [Dorea sp.]|nr:hypothetical protein [Dorea sp.]
MGGKILEYGAKAIKNEGAEEGIEKGIEKGRILTVRIFQEAKQSPDSTIEQIAEKIGCRVQEVADTLKMFAMYPVTKK